MNCKPGDLAWIIWTKPPQLKTNIGKIVKVQELWREKAWLCTSESSMLVWVNGETRTAHPGELFFCSDPNLRPFRNPGDYEVDESTRWLPPAPRAEPAPRQPTEAEARLKRALKLAALHHTYSMAHVLGIYPA